MLEALLWLAGMVAEFMVQVGFELFIEVGIQALTEPETRPSYKTWLAVVLYALLGAVAGAVSLWLFPMLFAHTRGAQLANLIVTPLACGAMMAAFGVWRRRRGEALLRLDRFAYGFVFALAMALVRFSFGQ